MTKSSPDAAVAALARFVRTELAVILAAWRQRLERLPPSTTSLAARGEQVVEWLAAALGYPMTLTLAVAVRVRA